MKQRILDASARLFAEKGFDGTSVRDIVEATNVGRALIYYYFEDKRALYDAVLLDGGERIRAVAELAYATEGGSIDRLRRFIVEFRQLHIDRPHIARVAMRAEVEGHLQLGSNVREHVGFVSGCLIRIVQEGIEKGELRPVEPRLVAHSVMGLAHSLNMMAVLGEASSNTDADIEFVVGLLTNGIAL